MVLLWKEEASGLLKLGQKLLNIALAQPLFLSHLCNKILPTLHLANVAVFCSFDQLDFVRWLMADSFVR